MKIDELYIGEKFLDVAFKKFLAEMGYSIANVVETEAYSPFDGIKGQLLKDNKPICCIGFYGGFYGNSEDPPEAKRYVLHLSDEFEQRMIGNIETMEELVNEGREFLGVAIPLFEKKETMQ